MAVTCWAIVAVLAFVVLLYGLIELHYFLRMISTILVARYCKKRVSIFDETAYYTMCFPTDVDTLLYHMNNARYLRELDFVRADFYERTDLYREICSQGSGVVQGATTIRYRRYIKPFRFFKVTSKIIYWDEKSFFTEHRFVTLSDGFVRAIAICRQRLLDCNTDAVISVLLNRRVKQNGNVETGVVQVSSVRPEIPPEVSRWIESNEISSAMLRQVPITMTSTTTTTSTETTTTTSTSMSMTTHC